ncbi:head-binding protein [Leclercia sp. W6]|uniref:head-binding protein n=1 Tax=Leclercia sp. W6 TaxID=2282310 RepID=UPI001FEFED76|nr:head-binding protein [Leclercia sp. W6]
MTVSTEVNHNEYTGNGVTTSFPYTFRVFKASDLVVVTSDTNGTLRTLMLNTDYTVTGVGSYSGGAVVLPLPLANAWSISIERSLPVVQETDLRNQGKFFAETHEGAFDYLTMLIQQCFGWARLALLKPNFLAKYYDAKQNKISNLADAAADQDAVNNRTMRNYVDAAIAGVVGGFGWFIQSGAGAIQRTFQSKMRDTVSVLDFVNSDPTGDSDSTPSFTAARGVSPHPYIPAGDYLVDSTQIDSNDFVGPGRLHTRTGHTMPKLPVTGAHRKAQRKSMEMFFGFDNGTTNTEIYPGAGATPQGLAVLTLGGVKKLFVLQRPGGASWTTAEVMRIVEFNFKDDGTIGNAVAFSQELHLGHQGFSGIVENGEVYFYSAMRTEAGHEGNDAGKGFTKIHWRGAATSDADVQSVRLWGYAGSGHRFESFFTATPCVSIDGRLLVLTANDSKRGAINDSGQTVFVYDRLEVEAAADPLQVSPLYQFPHIYPPEEGLNSNQGPACDGTLIHIVRGNIQPFGAKSIQTYTLDGEEVNRYRFDGVLATYTLGQMLNNATLGIPVQLEPEGIAIDGDDLHVIFADSWRVPGDIVSYSGRNWAALVDSTGVSPDSSTAWVETTKAATIGAWNATTAYSGPGNYNRRAKVLMTITRDIGAADLVSLQTGNAMQPPGAQFNSAGNATDFVCRAGTAWQMRYFSEQLQIYYNGFNFTGQGLQIFDSRPGADNAAPSTWRVDRTPGNSRTEFRAVTGQADGAWFNFYGLSDPANAGGLTIGAAGDLAGSITVNPTSFTVRAGAVGRNLGTGSTPWNDFFATRIRLGVSGAETHYLIGSVAPEGAVSAPPGSLYSNRVAGTLYLKTTGTGTSGWRQVALV